MKFGSRLVLYYSLISMIAMLAVGLIAIKSIETNWINTVEKQLSRQNEKVQDYIQQIFILEKKHPNNITEADAKRVTGNLTSGTGQLLIYNKELKLLSGILDVFEDKNFNPNEFKDKVLMPAQQGDSVNSILNNVYYYAAPIEVNGQKVGVLVINYKLDLLNTILSRIVRILSIAALLFCIVMVLLSIYISGKVVKPIKRLVEITGNYAKRDFTIVDITRTDELGQLSKSINEMGLQLKDYISRQKQFISNVSHEIRTPLTAIKGYSEYLADEVGGDPEMDKVVFHLNNETLRLTNMVNDLLQLSRLDSLQENFTYSEVNLSQVLAETVEKMRNRANSHAIEFCTRISEDIFVTGDRDKLIQVIVNILDNSIKYSPQEGKVIITLEENDTEAQLIISDQGSGIPAEDIEKVFDRFYRASNVNGINGTGLGLAISKEIIEKHKGSIKIENSDEGGTSVSILLPIKGKVLQH